MKKFFLIFFFSVCRILPVQAGFEYSPEWLAVVHYRPDGNGYKSTIDSDPFFLSPEGKTSPLAELAATIDLFVNSNEVEKKCLFPALYKLLKKNGLVSASFPKCEELEQFYKDLQPAGVTLLLSLIHI